MNVITNTQMAKVAIDKSLLREYDNRVVYLKDGDEFQIQLFNPKATTIAAEITINGVSCGTKLVLRPGERIWLERYLDRSKKFKFTTYEVDDTPEVESAIRNNGKIVVKFYDEVVKRSVGNSVWITKGPSSILYSDAVLSSPSNVYCSKTLNVGDNYLDLNSVSTSTTANYTASTVDTVSSLLSCSYDVEATVETNSVKETGIIEDGSHSNQDFYMVNKDFSYYPFKTEEIQILPVSQKPVYSEDVQKVYCTECGRKLQSKYKFCPFCGTPV